METNEDMQTPMLAPRNRLNPVVALAVAAAVLVIVLGLGYALVDSRQTQPTSGPAPEFTLKTYDGASFRLTDYRGKIILVNFWASWCAPCQEEAPVLNNLWKAYKDRGVVFIGVGYLDNEKDALGYLDQFNVPFPTGHDNGSLIARAYRIKGVPETFIINKGGEITHTMISVVSETEVRAIFDRLLADAGR